MSKFNLCSTFSVEPHYSSTSLQSTLPHAPIHSEVATSARPLERLRESYLACNSSLSTAYASLSTLEPPVNTSPLTQTLTSKPHLAAPATQPIQDTLKALSDGSDFKLCSDAHNAQANLQDCQPQSKIALPQMQPSLPISCLKTPAGLLTSDLPSSAKACLLDPDRDLQSNLGPYLNARYLMQALTDMAEVEPMAQAVACTMDANPRSFSAESYTAEPLSAETFPAAPFFAASLTAKPFSTESLAVEPIPATHIAAASLTTKHMSAQVEHTLPLARATWAATASITMEDDSHSVCSNSKAPRAYTPIPSCAVPFSAKPFSTESPSAELLFAAHFAAKSPSAAHLAADLCTQEPFSKEPGSYTEQIARALAEGQRLDQDLFAFEILEENDAVLHQTLLEQAVEQSLQPNVSILNTSSTLPADPLTTNPGSSPRLKPNGQADPFTPIHNLDDAATSVHSQDAQMKSQVVDAALAEAKALDVYAAKLRSALAQATLTAIEQTHLTYNEHSKQQAALQLERPPTVPAKPRHTLLPQTCVIMAHPSPDQFEPSEPTQIHPEIALIPHQTPPHLAAFASADTFGFEVLSDPDRFWGAQPCDLQSMAMFRNLQLEQIKSSSKAPLSLAQNLPEDAAWPHRARHERALFVKLENGDENLISKTETFKPETWQPSSRSLQLDPALAEKELTDEDLPVSQHLEYAWDSQLAAPETLESSTSLETLESPECTESSASLENPKTLKSTENQATLTQNLVVPAHTPLLALAQSLASERLKSSATSLPHPSTKSIAQSALSETNPEPDALTKSELSQPELVPGKKASKPLHLRKRVACIDANNLPENLNPCTADNTSHSDSTSKLRRRPVGITPDKTEPKNSSRNQLSHLYRRRPLSAHQNGSTQPTKSRSRIPRRRGGSNSDASTSLQENQRAAALNASSLSPHLPENTSFASTKKRKSKCSAKAKRNEKTCESNPIRKIRIWRADQTHSTQQSKMQTQVSQPQQPAAADCKQTAINASCALPQALLKPIAPSDQYSERLDMEYELASNLHLSQAPSVNLESKLTPATKLLGGSPTVDSNSALAANAEKPLIPPTQMQAAPLPDSKTATKTETETKSTQVASTLAAKTEANTSLTPSESAMSQTAAAPAELLTAMPPAKPEIETVQALKMEQSETQIEPELKESALSRTWQARLSHTTKFWFKRAQTVTVTPLAQLGAKFKTLKITMDQATKKATLAAPQITAQLSKSAKFSDSSSVYKASLKSTLQEITAKTIQAVATVKPTGHKLQTKIQTQTQTQLNVAATKPSLERSQIQSELLAKTKLHSDGLLSSSILATAAQAALKLQLHNQARAKAAASTQLPGEHPVMSPQIQTQVPQAPSPVQRMQAEPAWDYQKVNEASLDNPPGKLAPQHSQSLENRTSQSSEDSVSSSPQVSAIPNSQVRTKPQTLPQLEAALEEINSLETQVPGKPDPHKPSPSRACIANFLYSLTFESAAHGKRRADIDPLDEHELSQRVTLMPTYYLLSSVRDPLLRKRLLFYLSQYAEDFYSFGINEPTYWDQRDPRLENCLVDAYIEWLEYQMNAQQQPQALKNLGLITR